MTIKNAIVRDFIKQRSRSRRRLLHPARVRRPHHQERHRPERLHPLLRQLRSQRHTIGVHGLWIIGNAIHVSTQHAFGNDLCPNLVNLGENTQTDTIIAFNSIEGDIFRHDPANGTTVANNQIVGNVATRTDARHGPGCQPGYTVKYNVFYGSWASNCGDSSNALANAQQFASYDSAGWTGTPGNSIYRVTAARRLQPSRRDRGPPSARCRPAGATPTPASARPPTSTATRAPTLRTLPITMPAPTRTADGVARLVDAKQPSDEVADTQGRRDDDGRLVAWSSGGPASARFHRSPASPSG